MVQDVLAHSDDEFKPGKGYYVIKTLGYRSKNTSKSFRRLDVEMLKDAETSGRTAHRRVRKLPKIPLPLDFKKAPKNLAIDFYDPSWFNQLQPAQKTLVANTEAVAFLLNAAQSLTPVRHPDEKLGDNVFIGKYLDILKEPYKLSDEEEEFVENEKDSGSDTSIDLEAESDGAEDDESESDAYSEGDYGDLYKDKVEDSEKDSDEPKGKNKGTVANVTEVQEDDDDADDEDWVGEE